MKTSILSKPNKAKAQTIDLSKYPVVVLPLDEFEKMKEDLEMYKSKNLRKDIAKAREDFKKGKFLTFEEVKKKLKLK